MFSDPLTVVHPTIGMSVSEVIALLRDIGFFFGVLFFGWKARGWFQPGIDFFRRANIFMDKMQEGVVALQHDMQLLLVNHLPHIEKHLGIKVSTLVVEESLDWPHIESEIPSGEPEHIEE